MYMVNIKYKKTNKAKFQTQQIPHLSIPNDKVIYCPVDGLSCLPSRFFIQNVLVFQPLSTAYFFSSGDRGGIGFSFLALFLFSVAIFLKECHSNITCVICYL